MARPRRLCSLGSSVFSRAARGLLSIDQPIGTPRAQSRSRRRGVLQSALIALSTRNRCYTRANKPKALSSSGTSGRARDEDREWFERNACSFGVCQNYALPEQSPVPFEAR